VDEERGCLHPVGVREGDCLIIRSREAGSHGVPKNSVSFVRQLSAVGIYGMLAYLVTQRTKEIGIRMALGGTPRSVFDLVLKKGLALVGVGLAVGAFGAIAIRKSLEAQLYGVRSGDPAVLLVVTLVLGAVALVACIVPARRATRIDPVVALSQE
jgi:ABC-type antimicrobial peptide transport system permease subunit